MGGVLVATATDNTLTTQAVGAGLMASACAAVKVVFANQSTKKLNPIEASNLMAPYNIAILACVFYFTELHQLPAYAHMVTPPNACLCLAHGVLVFSAPDMAAAAVASAIIAALEPSGSEVSVRVLAVTAGCSSGTHSSGCIRRRLST